MTEEADPSVDRILVIADKVYAEKADGRAGGVGTETQIISPEVYSDIKQTKTRQKAHPSLKFFIRYISRNYDRKTDAINCGKGKPVPCNHRLSRCDVRDALNSLRHRA